MGGSRSPTSSRERTIAARTAAQPDLWAACIAGAGQRDRYLHDIAAAGLELRTVRTQPGLPLRERAGAGAPATSTAPTRSNCSRSSRTRARDERRSSTIGPIGRLGRWTARHFRIVAAAWVVVAVGLGVLAPRAENALSGAGWEATGSESVQARQLIDTNFNGPGSYGLTVVVHAPDRTVSDPAFARVLRRGARPG